MLICAVSRLCARRPVKVAMSPLRVRKVVGCGSDLRLRASESGGVPCHPGLVFASEGWWCWCPVTSHSCLDTREGGAGAIMDRCHITADSRLNARAGGAGHLPFVFGREGGRGGWCWSPPIRVWMQGMAGRVGDAALSL